MNLLVSVPEKLSENWITEQVNPLFTETLARPGTYLANHSLGRPLDRTKLDILEGLDAWYALMDGAWGPWMDEAEAFGKRIGSLLGWPTDGGVIGKSSCGQALRAVLNSFTSYPIRVIATRGEFDSIDFILKTYADRGLVEVHWIEPSSEVHGVRTYDPSDYLSALEQPADLVIISVVHFATGQVIGGLSDIIQKAHTKSAKVILDTYHAAGVLEWDAPEADFAIGGCYKYLRGGPGSCFLAVHPRWLDNSEFRTLDTGWFAKKSPFSYERPSDNPRGEGIQSWAESTPAVLSPYQSRAGLQLTSEIGVPKIRQYTLEILFEIREILKPYGGFSDLNAESWGGYALLPLGGRAAEVSEQFKTLGVNNDARSGCVRFGPDILTTKSDLTLLSEVAKKLCDQAVI